MIPPYPFRFYRKTLPPPEDEEANKSNRRRLARWLPILFGDEAPVLCRKCRHRKVDFRPLMKEPPDVPPNYPYENIEDDVLEDLEMENAVYINGFLLEEAMNTESRCSLCRILIACLDQMWKEGWLLNMRCVCIIRPRYEWKGFERKRFHGRKKFKIVHKYQVFVRFQPMEEEIILPMACMSRSKSARKGRFAIPATIKPELVRVWLRDCDQKHSHPAVSSDMISRVQGIISRGLFRVINTSTGSVEAPIYFPKFVALSYVWGPTANHSEPHESKPISAYAPTIRDAAVIARSIGFDWLWVDRICINQSSESEKAILIPLMKDIYAAAQLTIVAACGENGAQSGLRGSPESPRDAEKSLFIGSSVAILPYAQSYEDLIKKSIWSYRGWTFEEYVFSRRLLLFFDSEVFFSCGEHKCRESLGRRHAPPTRRGVDRGVIGEECDPEIEFFHRRLRRNPDNMPKVLKLREFMYALQEYTDRSLTFEEDRILAFAGVVMAVSTNPDEMRGLLRHGHPLRFFEVLLTWENKHSYRLRPRRGVKTELGTLQSMPEISVPSWSWASSPVRVGFHDQNNHLINSPDEPWFKYTLLHNQDILALPTTHNATPSPYLTGLELPAELIISQPWMKCVSNDLPLDHEARRLTESPVCDSVSPPILHMVTLLFDARFLYWQKKGGEQYRNERFVLSPLGSTETSEEFRKRFHKFFTLEDIWSLSAKDLIRYRTDGDSPLHPFETFALITGRAYYLRPPSSKLPEGNYFELYIMLLGATGEIGTYRRVGSTQLEYVRQESHFIEVIQKGRPRWQYIRIV
ncbi:heterokaryon incompatibility protein-domain-containing protein [Xylaria cf. heliscus]|nr:heterokaryon incompatibility protein-domain-containing protein [Xylaria cf. heliscus]